MDKRISDLNSATSLQGTEVFAVVQNGETKKTTLNSILYGKQANNYGLFNQTGSSVPIQTSTDEESLIGGGVGTLSVPPNMFQQGDAYHAVLTGVCTFHNGDNIRIKIKSDSATLVDTGNITVVNASNKRWKLEIFFSLNQIGSAGTAEISSGGTFIYSEDQAGKINGTNFSTINNTTFDTTILNTLVITAQFDHNDNTIYSDLFTLKKTY